MNFHSMVEVLRLAMQLKVHEHLLGDTVVAFQKIKQ